MLVYTSPLSLNEPLDDSVSVNISTKTAMAFTLGSCVFPVDDSCHVVHINLCKYMPNKSRSMSLIQMKFLSYYKRFRDRF